MGLTYDGKCPIYCGRSVICIAVAPYLWCPTIKNQQLTNFIMIRKAILTLGMLAVASAGYAQKVQPCATDEFYKAQKARFPGIAAEEARLTAEVEQYLKGRIANSHAKITGTVPDNWPADVEQLHIPVVVHIVQDFAGQFPRLVTDDDVYAMIARLNAVFNGTDPSITAGIINPFKPYIGNAHISFHLATKDPSGKPTRGITRINSYHSSGGDELAKINGWAPDQYLNIWFENFVGRDGAALYATFPTSYADNPYSQGIIGRADYSNPSNPSGGSIAVAHEVGHYLYLYHVWNSNSRPAEDRNPLTMRCGDDEVDDTPPTIGHESCSASNLYDTLCATGYLKNYDSATYYTMTGVKLPLVIASNDSSNTAVEYNDSTLKVIGQTFTNGSTNALLESISLRLDTAASNGGAVTMSLYNATGTILLAKSTTAPGVSPGSSMTFSFAGVNLAAGTKYKFVIDTLGGHRKFKLRADNRNFYTGGEMYTDSAAKTAVPGTDLYFVIKRFYRIDYPDTTNTQNIMDYSYCNSQMFTKGQTARMRAALRSDVGMRSRLTSAFNLMQTGVFDSVNNVAILPQDIAPTADFSVNRPFVCADGNADNALTFTDRSYNDTTTGTWTFDRGASNPTATTINTNPSTKIVTNTFSEAGWVTVSLTATGNNNSGSNTITRSDKVYAADPTAIDPNGYYQEFNPGFDLDRYPIFNYFGTNHRWEVVNNAGYFDNTSIRYANYDTRAFANINNAGESPRGDYADFYTRAFDLTGYPSACNLTFYSAGAFRTSKSGEMNDMLEIAASVDCGLKWQIVDSLKGGQIGNNGYRNDNFTPSWMGEWKQRSIPVPARHNQVFFRFRFKAGVSNPALAPLGDNPYWNFGTGNNFYLDRINITNAPLNVKNGVIVNLDMSVAPNPTSGAATVSLNGGDNSVADLSVTDVTGKLVYSKSVVRSSSITKVEIPADALTVKGMYLVKVVTNGATETQKLVVY